MQAPPALTRAELRELDRLALEEYGLPGLVLMENAGRGAAESLARELGRARAKVVIACGPGNNGGDGCVVARHLANAGHEVLLLVTGPLAEQRGDAATMRKVAERMRLETVELAGDAEHDHARIRIERADLSVDALLGTGFAGVAPRPKIARAIELLLELRSQGGRLVSLDLPSGLDADTGSASVPCVRADRTITFAAAKVGFANAARWTGAVEVVDIGAPRELFARVTAARSGARD